MKQEPRTDESIIASQLRHSERVRRRGAEGGGHKRDPDFWSVDELNHLVTENPERAWLITVALIDRAHDDDLAYIAAGPLEDLVRLHATRLAERIDAAARQNSRFRQALSLIWLSRGDVSEPILARLQELTNGQIQVSRAIS